MNVVMEKIDTSKRGNQSVELCKGEIPGARPVHYTIEAGSELVLDANTGYYHILILVEGSAAFQKQRTKHTFCVAKKTHCVQNKKY